jgi:hypothetical protein
MTADISDPSNQSTKSLVVTFPNGERYGVPARVVAQDRALFYAERDFPDDGAKRGERHHWELDYGLENPTKLTDWARNNMDWDDLRHIAEHLDSTERDLGKLWMDADFEVMDASEVDYE